VGDDHCDTVACTPFINVESRRVDPVTPIIELEMSTTQGLTGILSAFCLELNMANQVIGKWEESSLLNGPSVAFHSRKALCPHLSNQEHDV
jgi:hypothetical protein